MNIIPDNIDPQPLLRHFFNQPAEDSGNLSNNAATYIIETLRAAEDELREINIILTQARNRLPQSVVATLTSEQLELNQVRVSASELYTNMLSACRLDKHAQREVMDKVKMLSGQIFGHRNRRANALGRLALATPSLTSTTEPAWLSETPPELQQAKMYNQLMQEEVRNIVWGLANLQAYLADPTLMSLSLADTYNQTIGEELHALLQLSDRLMPQQREQIQRLLQAEQALAESVRKRDIKEINERLNAMAAPLSDMENALLGIASMLEQATAQKEMPMNASVFGSQEEREAGLNAAHPSLFERLEHLAKPLGIPVGEALTPPH